MPIGAWLLLPLLLLVSETRAAQPSVTGAFFALNTGDLKAELADARAEGRHALMLFFEQEGCPGCRHMKENVLSRKNVQDYYGKHFASLALDIFSSVPLRDFSGTEHTEKSYAANLKVRATPTLIFYDLKGAEIVRMVGPLQTPEEFLLLGQFVTSGAYKTRSFAQYKLSQSNPKGG